MGRSGGLQGKAIYIHLKRRQIAAHTGPGSILYAIKK